MMEQSENPISASLKLSEVKENEKVFSKSIAIEKQNSRRMGRIFRYQFAWKLVSFLALNYYLYSVILSASMDQFYDLENHELLPINIAFLLILFVDLGFRLYILPRFKGYISRNEHPWNEFARALMNMRRVLQHYLIKHAFLWEIGIMAVFLTSFFIRFSIGRYLRLIILLKMTDVIQYNNEIYRRLHAYPIARSVYTLLKIIYVIFLLAHYIGVTFYWIDQVLIKYQYYGTIPVGNNFYYQANSGCYSAIESLGIVGEYLYGIYFSMSLVSTIAYGDIVAKNPFENVYSCVLLIFSTLSIALLLEQFMLLVRQERFSEYEFIKKFNCLKEFMNEKMVPLKIQNRVRSYLVYIEYEKKAMRHTALLPKLASKLRKIVLFNGYSHLYLEKFTFLGIKKHSFEIGLILTERFYQAETTVFDPYWMGKELGSQTSMKAQGFEQPLLLFLVSGSFKQFAQYDSYSASFELTYPKNFEKTAFNFKEFFTGTRLKHMLKVTRLSKFICFNSDDFNTFLQRYDVIYSKRVREKKEKILCEECDYSFLDEICFICNETDHSFEKCPSAHYTISQYISSAKKVSNVLGQEKWTQQGRGYARSRIGSKKIKNVAHPSSVWSKFKRIPHLANFSDVVNKVLTKSIQQLILDENAPKFQELTKYDPNGVSKDFFIN